MRRNERVACWLLSQVHGGSVATHREDQSNTTWDVDLRTLDGKQIAVEVKTHHCPTSRETWTNLENVGHRVPAVKCSDSWILCLSERARVKDLVATADEVLARAEEDDIEEYSVAAAWDPRVATLCRQLNVTFATRRKAQRHNQIVLLGPVTGGELSSEVVENAIIEVTQDRRISRKFAEACGAECQLFIVLDADTVAWMSIILRHHRPARVPAVPFPVAHIWLAAQHPSGTWLVGSGPSGGSWSDWHEVPGQKDQL